MGLRNRKYGAINAAVEDMDARNAAIDRIREKHDPAYRRRKAAYLRGEITDLYGGILTNEEWLATRRDL